MAGRDTQSGVTLIELMISLALASIGVAATFGVGMTIMNAYSDHRRMAATERAARSAMEIVADALRNASAGNPNGELTDLVGCSEGGTIRVTNGGDGPDDLFVVHASGGVLTSLRLPFQDNAQVAVVTDGSEFSPGDYALVTDFETSHLIEIEDVVNVAGQWLLKVPMPKSLCDVTDFPVAGYEAGSFIIRAAISRFYVDNSKQVGGVPTLMLDSDGDGPDPGEPLAPGIEDFQVVIAVDVDGDGTVREDPSDSEDEWFYNAPGDPDPPDMNEIGPRAFRITIIARSLFEAGRADIYYRPGIEDRPMAEAPDPYRRRALTSTLEVRNLDGSP